MGLRRAPTCADFTGLRVPKKATHSGGHCARRGCEAKVGVLGCGTMSGEGGGLWG